MLCSLGTVSALVVVLIEPSSISVFSVLAVLIRLLRLQAKTLHLGCLPTMLHAYQSEVSPQQVHVSPQLCDEASLAEGGLSLSASELPHVGMLSVPGDEWPRIT